MPYHLFMKLIRTRVYDRKIRKLLSVDEVIAAEDEIAAHPEKWPVVQGTGGVRKARAARGGSGKSGGLRIMYYFWIREDTIYLLDVYAKNEQENITQAGKKLLRSIVEQLKEEDNA